MLFCEVVTFCPLVTDMLIHAYSVKRLVWRTLVLLCWTSVVCSTPRESFGQTTFAPSPSSANASVLPPNFQPGLMRIDFSITTVKPTAWHGEIQLSRGAFLNPVPLGVNATSGTDFFLSDSTQNTLLLHTCSPTTFCGIEATIVAPRDSRIELKILDVDSNRQYEKTIFVERLIDSATSIMLGEQGSYIEITRAPADELPVFIRKFNNDFPTDSPFLFRANETIALTVVPRSSSTKLSNDLTLVATAKAVDSEHPFWSESYDIPLTQIQQNNVAASEPSGRFVPCNFSITTPNINGVFEITLELFSKPTGAQSRLTLPLPTSRKTRQEGTLIARRVVQGVVIQDAPRFSEATNSLEKASGDMRGELLEVVDPTNPSWRKAFSKRSSLPFYKSTSHDSQRNGKTGDERRTTFADDNTGSIQDDYYSVSTNLSGNRTFAGTDSDTVVDDEGAQYQGPLPTVSHQPLPSTGLVLGQAPASPSLSTPFNKIFFNRGNKTDSNADLIEARERLDFVRRWERDRFNTFLRSLDRKTWTLSDDLWEKPLSSGSSRPFNSAELRQFAPPQTNFIVLEPNGSVTDVQNQNNKALAKLESLGIRYNSVSWEAYPLPIQTPGKPHLLEIEYPTNFPQKLGISILEPSFSGALLPNVNDTGVVVDDNPLSDRSSKDVSRHTILFWPRTKTPIILLSNCSSETPAAFGQIRIYRANESEKFMATPNRGRVFGLALTTPNVCEQFTADPQPSFFGLKGVEDWKAFDSATSRLLYYLSAYNYDATTLAVAADGSSLYPSRFINSNPKYDGGVFLPSGDDQSKKDVLALLMLRFESQGKSLVPLLKLNFTLPDLEKRLLLSRMRAVSENERSVIEGIEWIGPDSKRFINARRKSDGSGPYYNVLHPEVEREVLAIVRELASKYGSYASFGGLALDVGSNGWLALPDDVFYGMDDVTIGRFVRESNLQSVLVDKGGRQVQELLLAKGPERYRQRAEFIRDVCYNEWLKWRSEALYTFYKKVRETVAEERPNVRLYLIATNALDGPGCQSTLFPSLNSKSKLREALRLVGLDPTRYATITRQKMNRGGVSQVSFISGTGSGEAFDSSIALLRPETVATTKSPAQTAIDSELSTQDAMYLFSAGQAFPGVVFFHESEPQKLYDFDLQSPFNASAVELNPHAVPSNYDNRRRFARSMAYCDCLCFFDGGEAVPRGQEDALRDWIYVFKNLPSVPFMTWIPKSETASVKSNSEPKPQSANDDSLEANEQSIQPIVVRYFRNNESTWVYLLNTAPFHVNVELTLNRKNKSSYETFAGLRYEDPVAVTDSIVWAYTATPYDLVAIRVDDPRATIESVNISRPSEICGNDGRMQQAVQDFIDRIVIARKGIEFPLQNGDFEESFSLQSTDASQTTPSLDNAGSDKSSLLGLDMPQMNLFRKTPKQEYTPADPPRHSDSYGETRIPGWHAFGPNDVDVRLDTTVVNQGRASLKLSSTKSSGGVVSVPFNSPTTGRLCVQISFGVPKGIQTLPLTVCLAGKLNGFVFSRRIPIDPAVLTKASEQGQSEALRTAENVVWYNDVMLFDKLPLDGLEDLSLRFELGGPGEVWLDQIRLFSLAFANAEQAELMKLINTAEFRASQERVTDVMFMLDGYWARLLEEQIPDDSPLMASRPIRKATVATRPPEKTGATETDENPSSDNAKKFWNPFRTFLK